MLFKILPVIFFINLLLQPWIDVESYAGEGRWEDPWPSDFSHKFPKEASPIQTVSPGQKVVEGFILFFKEYISPVDGDRCPSHPTCSQYSLEAVRKHGALIGLVMTFDRLIHESDEIRSAPIVKVNESYRYYDPVENNDFWWYRK